MMIYKYFEKGRRSGQPLWITPYIDASGLGLLISIVKAVYSGDEMIGVITVEWSYYDDMFD